MWEKVKNYVERYHMIEKEENILIGLSGGADSVCLFRFLLEIAKPNTLKIYAVHVNHMIRSEDAKKDEQFVRTLCEKWDVPLKVYEVDVPLYAKEHHMSEEEAGREIRYQCFAQSAREWECQKIAVAHHADDLAETVIFRMVRGTGVFGLGAMKPIYEQKIRPLLCLTKKEILEVLQILNQDFVEDETNQELTYSRNYIRHEVIPALSKINPKASEHIASLAMQAQDIAEYLEPGFEHCYQSCVSREGDSVFLNIRSFEYLQLRRVVQEELLRRVLFEVAGHRKDISQIHIEQLKKLITQKNGKRLNLPYHVVVIKEEERLHFFKSTDTKVEPEKKREEIYYEIQKMEENVPQIFTTEDGTRFIFTLESRQNATDYTKGDCVKYFDYDKIDKDVCIRNRRDGDYFVIDRQKHKKMLRRYFIDAKIPLEKREHQLLLASGNHILWVMETRGVGRVSEEYKVTENTKNILKVTWKISSQKR